MKTYNSSLSPRVINGVFEFLKPRQKENGGFSASPRLPATIEDTYCALKIISLIQKSNSQKIELKLLLNAHITFLTRCISEGIVKGPKNLYQVLWCLNFCQFDINQLQYLFDEYNSFRNISLEAIYYLAKIRRLFQPNSGGKYIIFKKMPLLGTLEDQWKALYASYANGCLEYEQESDKIITWVKQCQNSDGGFGFLPGTTSYIENCYFALNILHLLDTALSQNRRKAVKQFAISCRTRSGGFSRRPDAAPFMDSTYYSVTVLSAT